MIGPPVLKGEHQHDAYGEIISQKGFAVELSYPNGDYDSIIFAYVDSDEELNSIKRAVLRSFCESGSTLMAEEF